jgi:hypothetical protein
MSEESGGPLARGGVLDGDSSTVKFSLLSNQIAVEHKARLKKQLNDKQALKALEARIKERKNDIKTNKERNLELRYEIERQTAVQDALNMQVFILSQKNSNSILEYESNHNGL